MGIFETLVGFVLGILGSYIATPTQPPIPNVWQRRLDERLADEAALREALASRRSLRDELRLACRNLSQNRALLGELGEPERQIWLLLSDADFQHDLVDWIMAGGIEEGAPVRERLEQRMERALLRGGAGIEQIATFKSQYFEAIDRAIFATPLLAAWRHQLSLDYLRREVAAVKLAAEKAAGIFSPEARQAALDRYADVALRTWDIIDLSNLPEGDIQIATQKLLLRQLYMPLRIRVEIERERASDEDAFAALERRRAVEPLIARLDDAAPTVRRAVAEVLGRYDDPRVPQVLTRLLSDDSEEVRRAAVQAFAAVRDETVRRLLSRDLDAIWPWIDPTEPITLQRVQQAAQLLGIGEDDIRPRYEALAAELPLTLEWHTGESDAAQ